MDKIGIIRLSSLGDIILSEPVSRNLKIKFPDSEIVFFTRQFYKPIVEMFESVDRIECLDIPGLDEKVNSLKNRIKEINQSFDLVIDIHKNIRSRIIMKNLNSTRRITYKKDRLNRQLAVWLKRKTVGTHTVDKYLEPLKRMGIPINRRVPKLKLTQDVLAASVKHLKNIGFEKNRFIVLAVGASFPPKQFPLAKYAQLAKIIDSELNLKVLIVDEKKQPEFDEIESSGTLGFGIGLDLQMLAAVLSLACMTISNDSGVMHLSSAVGTPTAGIFGPTHPVLGFAPTGEHSIVISTEETCAPCSVHGKKPCTKDKQYCFSNLEPDLIIDNVKKYLR